jgi:aromatic ring-opening dioxygenase catalytic subunit (LigB family)
MSSFSERDKELLAQFGMSEKQVEQDAVRMEDENADHGITGPVYYGLHMLPKQDERMVSVTIKMPESQLKRVTEAAKRYHISRSEYVRRQLSNA